MSDAVAGITSTGSKRPEVLFGGAVPGVPRAMVRSEGCRVWDAQGREYLDLIMGLGAVALGYADPQVTEAAVAAVRAG
ncbi:MAG: aminotransferase class III-fold pyridoxal phosphate-dependent enzyme, partial [Gemmatimonadales bacterium]|nr:aminotransferase class III-fold pyridoxal phosphate-dependent enzyme [Gemmatimonadales bacterium]